MESSSPTSQQILLIRHGETEWSRSGQHTGKTDIPLTDRGRTQAEALGRYLAARAANGNSRGLQVWTSPLGRARETATLAGLGDSAQMDMDLVEWNYGIYEGRTTADIQKTTPDWSVWHSPIIDGESLNQVAQRAGRVIHRVLAAAPDDVALFAHGHILRILASAWIALPPVSGRLLALDTASVSVLGFERQTRVIRQWNVVPSA